MAKTIVIATQGQGDKRAIAAALQSKCPHIRMVVSARKLEALKTQLVADGMDEKSLSRIEGPAGIDINARTPQEIALSALAEIVRLRRSNPEESDELVESSTRTENLVHVTSDKGGCCG